MANKQTQEEKTTNEIKTPIPHIICASLLIYFVYIIFGILPAILLTVALLGTYITFYVTFHESKVKEQDQ